MTQTQSVYTQCVAVFSCVEAKVWPPEFGIFNLRADVDACGLGLFGHCKRDFQLSITKQNKQTNKTKQKLSMVN